ncbi:MAG: potassium channel family protein [Candidatus Korobacteraceae bacterium]
MTVRRRLILACSLLLTLAVVAVVGYMAIGGPSVTLLDAVYMAVITLTGVGYGEIVDSSHNPALRIFNIFVVVLGVGFAVYVFSELTAFLVEGELRHLFRRGKMKRLIGELKHHFIVCGAGETGRHVIDELRKTGTPHVVVDISGDVVNRFREESGGVHSGMLYVIGDATDEEVLLQAGLDRAKGLISTLASDKDNLVITVVARQKNAAIRIISRCTDLRYSERMLKVGANSTVSPNRIGGLRLASEMLRPTVVNFLDLMLQEKSRTLRIEEISLGKASNWIGRSISELDLGGRYDLLLLALKSVADSEAPLIFNPPSSTTLVQQTVMILLGDIDNLRRAREDAHV